RRGREAVDGDVDVRIRVRIDLLRSVDAVLVPTATYRRAAEPGDARSVDRGQVGARVRNGRRWLGRRPCAVANHVERVDHRSVDEILLVEQFAGAHEEI